MRNHAQYEKSPVPSLDRGLAILELVAAYHPKGISFSEIVHRLQIPPATAARLLKALRIRQYLSQNQSHGNYICGWRIFNLLKDQREIEQLRDLLLPFVRRVRDTFQNTSLFIYWSGRDWVCLCKAIHEQSIVMQRVGEIRQDVEAYPWSPFLLWFAESSMVQARWSPSFIQKAKADYQDFIKQGYLIVQDVSTIRLCVPIFQGSANRFIGSLAIGGTHLSLGDICQNVGNYLVQIAQEVSNLLGSNISYPFMSL